MGANAHGSRHSAVIPFPTRSARAIADDLSVARRRMRHLAPWHVEPLPMMHSVIGKPAEQLSTERREHSEQVALQVLAIQMWLTNAQSAMH